MLFESYRGTSKFINSTWYSEFVSTVYLLVILMALKDPRFQNCGGVYNIGFFSFSGNQISRYITLSVLNCKLVENILHIFCLVQSWYDLRILRQ